MTGKGLRSGAMGYIALLIALLFACVIVVVRVRSDGVPELGDGVNHFLISRYAWQHPILLLDLWGKPLFTLLAAPFTVFGLVGTAVFNAVVAVLTAFFAIRCVRRVGPATQVAVPLLVFLAPQYVLTVYSGMTEPLFGLLTVLTVLLLLDEKPILAALIASFTPLARPEYVAFVPAVMLWLVLDRRWRVLPWTLFGLGVYALLTTIVYGDPLWFWVQDPYGYAGTIYGSGPLDHFVGQAEEVYGRPLLVLGVAALVLWPLVFHYARTQRQELCLMLVVAALPAILIFVIHTILWWKGLRGSAGLLRVLATSIPLTALFATYTLGKGAKLFLEKVPSRALWPPLALLVLASWSVLDLREQVELPTRPDEGQLLLERAADGVREQLKEGACLFSTHPYMAYGAEVDAYDQARFNMLWKFGRADVDTRLRMGDLLVWDTHLGANECGIPLEQFLGDERLALLDIFQPRTGTRVLGGHLQEIYLFERRNVIRTVQMDTLIFKGRSMVPLGMRVDTVPCADENATHWCMMEGEFPFEFRDLPVPTGAEVYHDWIVRGTARIPAEQRLSIVLKQGDGDEEKRYEQDRLSEGRFEFRRRIPRNTEGSDVILYLWNAGKQAFELEDLTVIRERWSQRSAE